jgi:hypothetical protein
MWGFDMSARVSEYTQPEPGATDHCVRANDLTFIVKTASGTMSTAGGELATLLGVGTALTDLSGVERILECRVMAASSKGKAVVKPKVIGRRSPEDKQFLEDLVLFILHSRVRGTEELFSYRDKEGRRSVLRGRDVRDAIKLTCVELGLPQAFFSSHLLRKGAITHMRAAGATEDDRRDRGNYAPGSQVMNTTYDYATGLGPLASNSLPGGYRPTIEDVRRLIPPVREK